MHWDNDYIPGPDDIAREADDADAFVDDPDEEDLDGYTLSCPHCGGEIYADADVCPHCRSFISDEDFERPGSDQLKGWGVVIIIVMILLLLAMMVL